MKKTIKEGLKVPAGKVLDFEVEYLFDNKKMKAHVGGVTSAEEAVEDVRKNLPGAKGIAVTKVTTIPEEEYEKGEIEPEVAGRLDEIDKIVLSQKLKDIGDDELRDWMRQMNVTPFNNPDWSKLENMIEEKMSPQEQVIAFLILAHFHMIPEEGSGIDFKKLLEAVPEVQEWDDVKADMVERLARGKETTFRDINKLFPEWRNDKSGMMSYTCCMKAFSKIKKMCEKLHITPEDALTSIRKI